MHFFFNHNQKYFCTSYSQFYYMFCVYSLLMKLRYTVTYNLKETGFYILLDDILKLWVRINVKKLQGPEEH